jgi:hypothetical protein
MIRFFSMINSLLASRVLLDERVVTRFQRPFSANRSGPNLAARRTVAITATLNRFSARTNVGLAAVALVLALLLTVTAVVRYPTAFLPDRDAETGLSIDVLELP